MARNPFHNSDSSGGESGGGMGAMVLDPETGEMIAAPSGGNEMQSDGLHNSSSSSSSSAQVGILPAV